MKPTASKRFSPARANNSPAIATEVVDTFGPALDRFHVDDAREDLDERAGRALASLFYDPIWWSPGEPFVNNGQHRTCALRVAGAERVPVAPGET